jgi:hypothetical protein
MNNIQERNMCMQPFGKLIGASVLGLTLLVSSESEILARGVGGAGPGAFGGVLRGAYQIQGKVMCSGCSVQDVQKASATHLHGLYVLKNKGQQVVLQIIQIRNTASGRDSRLGRWEAIVGMTNQVSVRAEPDVWSQLIATKHQHQEVQLTGLLQSTGTFDVSELTFLE